MPAFNLESMNIFPHKAQTPFLYAQLAQYWYDMPFVVDVGVADWQILHFDDPVSGLKRLPAVDLDDNSLFVAFGVTVLDAAPALLSADDDATREPVESRLRCKCWPSQGERPWKVRRELFWAMRSVSTHERICCGGPGQLLLALCAHHGFPSRSELSTVTMSVMVIVTVRL